jgi:hypothetical protein
MRTPAKPYRAACELTDAEDDAFAIAIDRYQGTRDDRVSRQSVLRELISRFCKDQGVRFPAPTPKGRNPRRSAVSVPPAQQSAEPCERHSD